MLCWIDLGFDMDLDKKGVHYNNWEALEALDKYITEGMLMDTWRIKNEDRFQFTSKRETSLAFARLDYIIISRVLTGWIEEIEITLGFRSGHSPVSLGLKSTDFDSGRGFRKLNMELLENQAILDKLGIIIDETVENNKNGTPASIWEMSNSMLLNFVRSNQHL